MAVKQKLAHRKFLSSLTFLSIICVLLRHGTCHVTISLEKKPVFEELVTVLA